MVGASFAVLPYKKDGCVVLHSVIIQYRALDSLFKTLSIDMIFIQMD